MAIKNASDLLVYRLYPVAVKQVTRVRIKTSSPLSATGSLNVKNQYNAAGEYKTFLTEITPQNNSALSIFSQLSSHWTGSYWGYTETSQVIDGDYTYVDFTSAVAQDNIAAFDFSDGTSTINPGAIEVIVLTQGEDAGTDPVAHSTSASISFNNDLRDVTTKDSVGFQENIGGLKSFELSTDALQDISADQDFNDFFGDLNQRNEVSVQFSERGSGVKWEGSGYISSLSMDAGVEENVTYSVSITGTSSVVKGTY